MFLDNFDEDRVCVLDAAGDRHDDEIIKLGTLASQTYKRLYLYEGSDNHGRQKGEITGLLKKGAGSGGIAEENILTFDRFEEACHKAISDAEKNQMVVILTAEIERLQQILKI
jgi:cyanophycin synthetase